MTREEFRDYVGLLRSQDEISYYGYSKLVNEIDTLEQEEQKSGKWILTHLSNMAYCSECDYLFKDIPASIVEHFKHCPNCGAKMESEDEK